MFDYVIHLTCDESGHRATALRNTINNARQITMESGTTYQKEFDNGCEKPLLTAKDVAARLLLREKMVHQLVRDGKLACVQITSRERRFTEKQVREFVERQSQQARVDKSVSSPLSSPQRKGGAERKSAGDVGTDLVKEIRSLCR